MSQIIFLDWYDRFKCVGGACPLTCCGGWKIDVKENEVEAYKNLAHSFSKNIVNAIDEDSLSMKQCNNRCMLLNEEGLCQIVLECGEEHLSYTCQVFPRSYMQYGDVVEALVEIVCPIVAEYLLSNEKINFGLGEINTEKGKKIDYQLYDTLAMARTFLVDLFQMYNGEYNAGKIYIMLSVLDVVNGLYTKNNLMKETMLQCLERYDTEESCKDIFLTCEDINSKWELKAGRVWLFIHELYEKEIFNLLVWQINQNILEVDLNSLLDIDQLRLDMVQFVSYFRKNYSSLIENYFVYSLFKHWIPKKLNMDIFEKRIWFCVIELCIIQLCAMAIWKSFGEISNREYSIIIAGIDRMLSHSRSEVDKWIENLEEYKDKSIIKILLLLIC